MVERNQEGTPLCISENRIILTQFIQRNTDALETRFPIQVGAARKASDYLSAIEEGAEISVTKEEFGLIVRLKGYSQTPEERQAFQSVLGGLLTLKKLSNLDNQGEILKLGKELGLIL